MQRKFLHDNDLGQYNDRTEKHRKTLLLITSTTQPRVLWMKTLRRHKLIAGIEFVDFSLMEKRKEMLPTQIVSTIDIIALFQMSLKLQRCIMHCVLVYCNDAIRASVALTTN